MENSKISPEACYSIVLQASIPITPMDLEFKTIETTRTEKDLSQMEIYNLNSQKGVEAYRFGKKIKKSDIEGIYFPHEEAILSLSDYLKAAKKILKTGVNPKDNNSKEEYKWRLNNIKKSLASVFSDYRPKLQETAYPDCLDMKVIDETEGIILGKSPEDPAGMG
jgi:hypothetical protein